MTRDGALNRAVADARRLADREAACQALQSALARGDTKDMGKQRQEAYRLTHAILKGKPDE